MIQLCVVFSFVSVERRKEKIGSRNKEPTHTTIFYFLFFIFILYRGFKGKKKKKEEIIVS